MYVDKNFQSSVIDAESTISVMSCFLGTHSTSEEVIVIFSNRLKGRRGRKV